jgi:hypothetical protein
MIEITDAKNPPLRLTQAQYDYWRGRYAEAYRYYYGSPPDFESWVRNQLEGPKQTREVVDKLDYYTYPGKGKTP